MLDLEKINLLASKLKKQRQKKGLSLEQANKQTRIHLNILRAFEEGNFSVLSPTYIKGFLKRYAEYLGLNPQEILNEYITNYPQATDQVIFLEKEKRKAKIVLPKGKKKIIRPLFILVIGVIVFVVLGYAGTRLFGFMHAKIRQARLNKKTAVIARKAKEKEAKDAGRLLIPKDHPIILVLKATGDSWLQVKTDGNIIFTGTLKKNDRETWEAMDKIELRVGKPENLLVELNQKPLGKLNKRAGKTIVITREGIKK